MGSTHRRRSWMTICISADIGICTTSHSDSYQLSAQSCSGFPIADSRMIPL
jgi:hypothetical protein